MVRELAGHCTKSLVEREKSMLIEKIEKEVKSNGIWMIKILREVGQIFVVKEKSKLKIFRE